MNHLLNDKQYHLSDWYVPEHSEIITYFDLWTDLRQKLRSADFVAMRQKNKKYAKSHQKTTIDKWNMIFSKILKDSES